MGLLEWLGGVKKGQYDEAIARCDVIEENLQLRSRGTEAFARLEALQTRQVERERERALGIKGGERRAAGDNQNRRGFAMNHRALRRAETESP